MNERKKLSSVKKKRKKKEIRHERKAMSLFQQGEITTVKISGGGEINFRFLV